MTTRHLSLLLTSVALLLPATLGCSPAQDATETPAGTAAPGDAASPPADNSANPVVQGEPIAESGTNPGGYSTGAVEAPAVQPAGSVPAPSETEAAAGKEALPSAAGGDAFVVEGQFSVASPGNGYKWAEVAVKEIQGVTGRYLACKKEGSTSAIVLAVEHRRADSNGARVAALKGHFNGLVQGLKSGGFTELKGKPPTIEGTIPGRVDYAVNGLKPSGDPVFILCATVFGNNVYSFQVLSGSEKEAAFLYNAVGTLREVEK